MFGFRRFLRRAQGGRETLRQRLVLSEVSRPEQDLLRLRRRVGTPVVIESAELLRRRGRFFVRMRSTDGAVGVAVGSERLHILWPVMTQRVLPWFVGQDARDIERLMDEVARQDGNYKLAGLAFWSCMAGAELAAFDLLGKMAGVSAAELLVGSPGCQSAGYRGGDRRERSSGGQPPVPGGTQVGEDANLGYPLRRVIPVYLSSLRRETTPDEEVRRLAERLAATGARAVKFKIGGRMGRGDAMPGRTERLVALARRTFGDGVTIHVDANGSYTAEQAIDVGRMLEDHGVYLFEEPCAWEDFEATKRVADQLDRVLVAGGEQEGSFEKFRWMVGNRGVDVVQPDVVNNGGFVRTLRVARLAAAAGMDASFHSAKSDFSAAYMLHMAAVTQNLGPFQEFLEDRPAEGEAKRARPSWYEPRLEIRGGVVAVPMGPGLGVAVDPAELRRARVVR
jgi:L-alanine-DL-glutamate epimerase-like enolase superfamily enzyme